MRGISDTMDRFDGKWMTKDESGSFTLTASGDPLRILARDSLLRREVMNILHRVKHTRKLESIVVEIRSAVINLMKKGESGHDTASRVADTRDAVKASDQSHKKLESIANSIRILRQKEIVEFQDEMRDLIKAMHMLIEAGRADEQAFTSSSRGFAACQGQLGGD
mmetsp:Transcript_56787/g.139372  ORF Transcript_56787/g.139372 Transcript_56787/m.139372 type:complete len:165 (-) Transcript_56787:2842-3336(-)